MGGGAGVRALDTIRPGRAGPSYVEGLVLGCDQFMGDGAGHRAGLCRRAVGPAEGVGPRVLLPSQ